MGPWDLVMVGISLQVIFTIIIPTKRDFVRSDNVRNPTTDDGGGCLLAKSPSRGAKLVGPPIAELIPLSFTGILE